MDCLETKKSLALYLDDLLEGHEAEALEAHLFVCNDCRNERDRVERLFAYGAALPQATPSPRVWENIRAALREPRPVSWNDRVSIQIERWREIVSQQFPSYAAGAASAALLLLFVFPIGRATQGGLHKENDRPLHQASLVPDPVYQDPRLSADGYPVRTFGGRATAPGKRLVLRNGELWEVEEPPTQPRVNFPVRDVGSPAALRKDF